MNVLVTGSEGFIGKWVKAALRDEGYIPYEFDLSRGDDVRSKAQVRAALENADAVIHLAGLLGTHELWDNIDEAIDINTKGAVNVLEACHLQGNKPFVMIEQPHIWYNPYETTKEAAHRFAMGYHLDFGVPVHFVTVFNAYGPFQHHGLGHPQKIIPTFANHAWQGQGIPIWGDGEQIVDLIDVISVAKALVRPLNGSVSLSHTQAGTGVPMTVNEVADYVRDYVMNQGGVDVPEHIYLPMRRGENTDVPALADGRPYPQNFDFLNYTLEWYRQYPSGVVEGAEELLFF